MTTYLINYILIILVYFSDYSRSIEITREIEAIDFMLARSKRVCVVAGVNAIILSTFRDWTVGADTLAYEWTFGAVGSTSWESLLVPVKDYFFHFSFLGDPSFYLLNKIFYTFSSNFQWWLLFVAVAFMIPCAIFIYRYSSDVLLSWVLFFALFFSFFGTTGLRQTLACSIVYFIGVPLIEKKKPISFVITVFVASSFHGSSLCFLPMYWITKIKFNRIVNMIYWLCVVVAFAFNNHMLALLQMIGGYDQYSQYSGAGAPTFTVLLIAIGIIITLYQNRIIGNGSFIVNYSLHSAMIALVFAPLLLINPSLMRVIMYFSFFLITLLPEFKNLFTENSKGIFKAIVIAMLILLSLRTANYKWGEFMLFD